MSGVELYKRSIHKDQQYFGKPGVLNHFFYTGTNKVINYGQKQIYDFDSLFGISKLFDQQENYKNFKKIAQDRSTHLIKMFRCTLDTYLAASSAQTFSYMIQIFLPLGVKNFMRYLISEDRPLSEGILWGSFLILTFLTRPYFIQFAIYYNVSSNIRTNSINRMHVANIVSRMALQSRSDQDRSSGSHYSLNFGRVAQLINADSNAMATMMTGCFQLWTAPLLILGYIVILFWEIGLICIVAPILLFLLSWVQVKLNAKIKRAKLEWKRIADIRSKKISEMIEGIAVIKYNAWEKIIDSQIRYVRKREISLLFKYYLYKGVGMSLGVFFPLISCLIVFWGYNFLNEVPLTLPQTYSLLALFNNLLHPVRLSQVAYTKRISAMISSRRYDNLKTIELKEPLKDNDLLEKGSIRLKNLTLSFFRKSEALKNQGGMETERKGLQEVDGQAIRDVTLDIKPGQLIGVAGNVGSGKSALLLGMLGELVKIDGLLNKNGTIAYVPQETFILNDTIRNNILFGNEYNEEFYERVLELCELNLDLAVLEAGDLTQIGERGINLSGGQKQRVSLARAVYSDSDIYLIDDALSALDSHVGQEIMKKVILNFLGEKTRIFVTHALQYLKRVDEVILMSEGEIVLRGDYSMIHKSEEFKNIAQEQFISARKLSTIGGELSKAASESLGSLIEDEVLEVPEEDVPRTLRIQKFGEDDIPGSRELNLETMRMTRSRNPASVQRRLAKAAKAPGDKLLETKVENPYKMTKKLYRRIRGDQEMPFTIRTMRSRDQLIIQQEQLNLAHQSNGSIQTASSIGILNRQEDRVKGLVPLTSYKFYVNSATVRRVFLTVCFYTSFILLRLLTDWWIGKWTEDNLKFKNKNIYPTVYLSILVAMCFSLFLRSTVFGHAVTSASYKVFEKVPFNLLRRKMSFFETTPSGIIMNRCTKDVNECDVSIPGHLTDFFEYSFLLISCFLVMFFVSPYAIIIFCFFFMVGMSAFKRYVKVSVEFRRLHKMASSPVLSKLSEMMEGMVTIRSYGKTDWMLQKFEELSQLLSVCTVHDRMTYRWLKIRVEYPIWLMVTITFICLIINKENQILYVKDKSIFGLLVTYMMVSGNLMSAFICSTRRVMTEMSSVERLQEYSDNKLLEAGLESKEVKDGWMTEGHLEIVNLMMRYRVDTPMVLKGVSFDVSPGEKVGVVGRTGSGKSTLIRSILRTIEIPEGCAKEEGSCIKIDGVDIKKLSLHQLRKNISIIPQDPFFLEGTLRYNMDPRNEFETEDIVEALVKVNLYTRFKVRVKSSHKDGSHTDSTNEISISDNETKNQELVLSFVIKKKGSNLSAGEKQLLCIARTLIRKPKILLMDEATASIDEKSDEIVQKVLANEMQETSVITVAHRLITLARYDKIVVLDDGLKVAEGSVLELLGEGGCEIFEKMVLSHGGNAFKRQMIELANQVALEGEEISEEGSEEESGEDGESEEGSEEASEEGGEEEQD